MNKFNTSRYQFQHENLLLVQILVFILQNEIIFSIFHELFSKFLEYATKLGHHVLFIEPWLFTLKLWNKFFGTDWFPTSHQFKNCSTSETIFADTDWNLFSFLFEQFWSRLFYCHRSLVIKCLTLLNYCIQSYSIKIKNLIQFK